MIHKDHKIKFVLSIELGNSHVKTEYDVARALEKVAKQLTNITAEEDIEAIIYDCDGNNIGKWAYKKKGR